MNLFSKPFLSLDLGTDFVKIVSFKKTDTGLNVSALSQQSLPPGAIRGGIIADFKGVVESCGQALKELDDHPRSVVVSLGGELVYSATTTAKMTRHQPTSLISQNELNSIHKKVEEAAFISASGFLAGVSGNSEVEVSKISSKILSNKIDGFVNSAPKGFKGEVVEVFLFSTYTISSLLENVNKLVKTLGLIPVAVYDSAYTLSSFRDDFRDPSFNAILIDVGGEATTVTVVFGGVLVGARTVGLGGRFFTEAISQKLGISRNEAELRKLNFIKHQLSEDLSILVKQAISFYTPLWLRGVLMAISDLEGIKTLPSTVILGGGGSLLPGLSELIKTDSWTRNLPFKSPINLELLQLKSTHFVSEVDILPQFFPAVAAGLVFSYDN